MSCRYNDSFKNIIHISDNQLMNKLEINLKTWFDWAFLRIGGWIDVNIPTINAGSGDHSRLRMVHDPQYIDGQVWESARKDWVWESEVDYIDKEGDEQNPISPAIITLNGNPANPVVNYPLGRVIFPSAQPLNSVVRANYSFRYVQVSRADEEPWWQELQYRSFNVEDSHFTQVEKGVWSIGSQHRVQMPCIILEAVPRSERKGYQLGDGSAWVDQDVLCHIIADNRQDRNQLVDILAGNFDKSFWMFDDDKVVANNDSPLDINGDILDSTKTYPYFVDEDQDYRYDICRISRTSISEVEAMNPRLFEGVVRLTCTTVTKCQTRNGV